MIRVLVVDDHPIVLEGMKQILERADDIVVADEACNGAETLNKVFQNNYDVVLLDISIPGREWLVVLKRLLAEKPGIPVLILSMYPQKQYELQVLKKGASGYLSKKKAPYELISAIRKVARDEKYITPPSDALSICEKSYAEKQPSEIYFDAGL